MTSGQAGGTLFETFSAVCPHAELNIDLTDSHSSVTRVRFSGRAAARVQAELHILGTPGRTGRTVDEVQEGVEFLDRAHGLMAVRPQGTSARIGGILADPGGSASPCYGQPCDVLKMGAAGSKTPKPA